MKKTIPFNGKLPHPLQNMKIFKQYVELCGYKIADVSKGDSNVWFNQTGFFALIVVPERHEKHYNSIVEDFSTIQPQMEIKGKTMWVRLSKNDLNNEYILKNRVKFIL